MLNLIEKLLINCGHKKEKLQNETNFSLYLSSRLNLPPESGFIIYEIQDFDVKKIISEIQSSVLRSLEPTFGIYERVEKNVILIFLIQHSQSEQLVNSNVSQIEEDQYFFKKQVFFYSSEELSALSNLLNNSDTVLNGSDIERALEEILYDKVRFNQFSDGNDDALYGVVTRLYAKLPFLTIKSKDNVAPDLEKNIKTQLEVAELLTLRDHLLKIRKDPKALFSWVEETGDEK